MHLATTLGLRCELSVPESLSVKRTCKAGRSCPNVASRDPRSCYVELQIPLFVWQASISQHYQAMLPLCRIEGTSVEMKHSSVATLVLTKSKSGRIGGSDPERAREAEICGSNDEVLVLLVAC